LARRGLSELRPVRTEDIETAFFNLRSDLEGISDLQASIADKGLIQPIVVRESGGKYQLICGHRRLQACKNLGWKKIRAVVMDVPDKAAFEMAIAENVQRSSLDPYEEAEAFRRYVSDYGWGGVSELARKIGKSEDFVSHRILLLNLPASVRVKVGRRQLSVSQASELIWLQDGTAQDEMAEKLAKQDVSFRDTRRIVRLVRQGYSVPEAFDVVEPLAEKDEFPEAQALKLLKRGILSCRSSLFVLDSVIGDLEGHWGDLSETASIVLEQRVALHGLIDRMVTEKVRLERKLHRLGL
jgi:ParB family chromosome partitioning protein